MEQEIFVHAYEVVRPIVLKASRQYFIQLWDQADMGARGYDDALSAFKKSFLN